MKSEISFIMWRIVGIFLLFLPLSVAALKPNIGYVGEAKITEDFIEMSQSGTFIFNGNVTVSFSPLLYPISYLAGSSFISREFVRTYYSVTSFVWYSHGTGINYYEGIGDGVGIVGRPLDSGEVEGDAMFEVVVPEFSKNFPCYLGLALAIIAVLDVVRKKRQEKGASA